MSEDIDPPIFPPAASARSEGDGKGRWSGSVWFVRQSPIPLRT